MNELFSDAVSATCLSRFAKGRTALMAIALLLCAPWLNAQELQTWSGAATPAAFSLASVSAEGAGRLLSLEDFKGRVLLVNFWATWCGPCVEEMPALQLLREDFKAERFEVLAINNQEGVARVASFLKTMDLDLPILRDSDGAVARAWQVRLFPTSFLLDANGNIRYVLRGTSDWTSASIKAKIRALLPP